MALEYNHADIMGGAIFLSGADISWDGSTDFRSNIASNFGGALSAVSGANVSWSGDTTFKDNRATVLGGAINVDSADVSWSGVSSFLNNSAEEGGAVHARSGSFVRWTGNTTFKFNLANVLGGAVSVDGADISWSGDTAFKNNRATFAGGAINVNSADVSWSGVSLFCNNTAIMGGAIYSGLHSSVQRGSPSTIFAFNTATVWGGGAVHFSESNLSWSGSTTFEYNQANTSGGAIYAYAAALSWSGDTNLEYNRAVYGGASASNRGAMDISSRSNVSWGGLSTAFMYNKATWIGGGAISVADSNLFWSGATLFLNNSAALLGGGVIAWASANVNWRGDTMFVNNNAFFGGAVYLYQGVRVKWTGHTTFSSNEAREEGGAVASTASVTSTNGDLISFLLIAGVTDFVDNISGRNGGAFSLGGGLFVEIETTARVSFRRNYARVSGGAIFMSGVDVGTIFRGVTFVSNSAQFGGGVHATSSGNAKFDLDGKETFNPTIFDRCSFVDNTAIATGGAIQSAAGQDYIISTSFIGNTARAGGALFLAGTAIFLNCSFFDNEADEDEGPAISNIGYVEKMQNSSFAGNAYNCAPGTFRAFDMVRFAQRLNTFWVEYSSCVSLRSHRLHASLLGVRMRETSLQKQ